MKKAKNVFIIMLLVVICVLGGWLALMYFAPGFLNRLTPSPTTTAAVTPSGTATPTPTSTPTPAKPTLTPEPTSPTLMTFTSAKGVVVRVNDWMPNNKIRSPLTVTGQIPGSWSFEGSFPVVLQDASGRVLAQTPARIQGEWMTTNHVPFAVTLEFIGPTTNKTGTLILRKDNPSDLAQNDDSISIPVTFA